ncbi:MAG: DUF2306 domain-containing protein [Proteobacteria bacterium]|nr:DUF2306 domain-containing protein [Pseudomonadota bacterium]
MQLTPLITVHLAAALAGTAVGPIALWARRRGAARPRLHRIAGYSWVLLMLVTALSAVFIRDYKLPNLAGYTPIHLLVPALLGGLTLAFWRLARHDIAGHRRAMRITYLGACLVAGAFTLLPSRYLGGLLWHGLLGL